jgi:hypothetical protein
MGLNELIESRGVPYNRKEFSLVLLPSSSMGSYNALPSSVVLLSMNVTHTPTRVRLYSTSQSVMLDASRPTGSFDVALGVGLAAEVYFSAGVSSITFDPPIICSSVEANPTFWYNISSSVNGHSVRFTALPLGEPASADFRTTVSMSHSGVANTGNGVTGVLTTPKTYLLLSASADVKSRLRLYSAPVSEVPSEETTRAFGVFPPTGSKLIADLMLDTPNAAYPISPTLPALTWAGSVYQTGTGVTGYRLQNMSSTTPATISASISVYSLED